MENYIIILIAIASFLYKMYSNYMKEVDEAKKRNYKKLPETNIPTTPNQEQPAYQEVKRHSNPTYDLTNRNIEDNNASIPEEVRKLAEYKKLTRSNKEKEIINESLDKQPFVFDLRQAVIQNAILERPY